MHERRHVVGHLALEEFHRALHQDGHPHAMLYLY
jgi:hypothetical protein